MEKYFLVDSGDQRKLEQFGPFLIERPCSQALWKPLFKSKWKEADARFSREEDKGWMCAQRLPESWVIELEGVKFKLSATEFGHLGVFPEHSTLWKSMQELVRTRKAPSILNLFAYSGGATLALAQAGAKVCHVDASKGMVSWARENAALNDLTSAPIRWIVDDVFKFLNREIKRGVHYDGIILDPPSFGRGSRQEVFKIERDIHPLLDLCSQLLASKPLFLTLTTHTPGMTPLVLKPLVLPYVKKLGGSLEVGEMLLPSKEGISIPSGSFARWSV